jgi:hypothetical protein
MALSRSTLRHGKLLAASCFALTLLTTGASAYSPQQEQMCTGDAMRLCGEYIPNVDRITTCMVQKYSELSDGCKAVFDAPVPAAPAPSASSYSPAPTSKRSKPLNIAPNFKRG